MRCSQSRNTSRKPVALSRMFLMRHPGLAGRTSLSFRDALSSLIVANRSRFHAYAATADHDRRETVALWKTVSRKLAASLLARSQPEDWATVIADGAIENTEHSKGGPVWRIVYAAALELMPQDPLMAPELPPVPAHLSLEQGVALRALLRQKQAFLDDFDRCTDLWGGFAKNVFGYVAERISASTFEAEEGGPALQGQLIDLLEKPGDIIQALITTLEMPELAAANLFRTICERIWLNVCRVSNVNPADFVQKQHRLMLPGEADMSPSALVDNYLEGTPFT